MDGEYVQKDSDKTFTDFERVSDDHVVVVEASPRDGSTDNGRGLVERYHRIILLTIMSNLASEAFSVGYNKAVKNTQEVYEKVYEL